jgi:penicillin-binding protein 1A
MSPRQRALFALKWVAISAVALAALAAVLVAGMFWYYGSDPNLPRIASLNDYKPKQVSRVLAPDGVVVGEIYEERRTFVPIDQIPEKLVQAFISAEDDGFFEHSGIDYIGMVRAVFVNVKAGHKRQGASTITQQVVKTFLLSPERTYRRKVQEIILARRLENALDKREILTLYLNQIYFGHGRYGIAEAARYYFGKDVGDLNTGEIALIAGLPKAPERISPKKPENVGRAKGRQKYVLEQMARNGYITPAEAQTWIEAPIEIIDDPAPAAGEAPEWIDLVRREMAARFGEASLATAGIDVATSIDREAQAVAIEALRAGLRAVDERQGYGRPVARVKADQVPLRLAKLARRLPKGGPRAGETYEAVVLSVHDADAGAPGELVVDLGTWRASVILAGALEERFNPNKKRASERFGPGDVVQVQTAARASGAPRHSERTVALAPGPEGAVVVMNPQTRDVLAVVGGYRMQVGDFNRAVMAKRQPGSAFKPFVYAAALDTGTFTPASIVNDAPEVYDTWKPENYEKGTFAGPVRLRYALAKSINTVPIRLIEQIGPSRVAQLANAMGIDGELPEHRSLALGSGEVTLLGLTNAYATLAAAGVAAKPRFIRTIGAQAEPEPEAHAVLRPQVAYLMTSMLRSVVTEGTATRAAALPVPVVGKTGTTDDARDAWFVGMTPSLVVGVWVGFDSPRPIGRKESGSRTALPVFVDIVKHLGRKGRVRLFDRPEGVVEARIDKRTGLLAPTGATDETSYTEVFIDGTVPIDVAPTEQEIDVDDFVLEQYDDGDGMTDEAGAVEPVAGEAGAGVPGAGRPSGGAAAPGAPNQPGAGPVSAP